jgi:hypothetical protein
MPEQTLSRNLVLVVVTRYYLKSADFNGISVPELCEAIKTPWASIVGPLRTLVENEQVGILAEGSDIDTHVLRMGFPSREMQLAQLDRPPSPHTCIYPLLKHLAKVVDPAKYADKPYRFALALGEPQLAYRVFDLSVLEVYRKNPRYRYWTNDVGGQICINGQRPEDASRHDGDQVLLPTFGFAYDAAQNRAVAVLLHYLANLTPKHQQIWKAKELKGKYELYPDYFGTTILGNPPEGASIYAAVVAEIKLINEVARAMRRPDLFQEHFEPDGEDRVRQFGCLVRPTLSEFNGFVHVLDKLMSESINREFFRDDVPSETGSGRDNGNVAAHQKGTLEMLVDWGSRVFPASQLDRWLQACRALRKVRSLRQRPEQAADENAFDQSLIKRQRELMISTYKSLHVLREMMSRHPAALGARLNVPKWIRNGRVWAV